MGEKIIILLLFFCMVAGIVSGPYLWNFSNGQSDITQKQKKKEAPEESTANTTEKEEQVPIDYSTIRVLISNRTLGKYNHDVVKITSDQDYFVKTEKKTVKKKAKAVTTLKYDKKKKGQTVTFSGTDKLRILSIKRAYGTPAYRGTLEVKYENGCFHVINQLLLEEYLYAVIPSEMPVSYGSEALKVQAICARSFAVKQKKGKKFKSYGADMDDSVASQVYNNTKECEESIRASVDTAGKVLTYDGEIVSAYFFSTSWGHTADSHDVWLQKGKSPVYLTGKIQNDTDQNMDLSSDDEIKKFLNSDAETFDSSFPWYRWSVTIPVSRLSAASVGSIRDIRVTKRGKSGVAKELRITGSGGVRVIQGEYNIRAYLSPKGISIKRKDGSNGSADILPSGCFYIEEKGKRLIFHGGGYGHGVGMSQNGVKKQAENGKRYSEILQFYYTGTKIKDISECE
ncbi:MAG: SpoIID/LytB domain-containing protein [Lachnospiraceae bacterium]|nr:SpoIID/LytB domain-containing protein [Lachnospiraceae bacterium]